MPPHALLVRGPRVICSIGYTFLSKNCNSESVISNFHLMYVTIASLACS